MVTKKREIHVTGVEEEMKKVDMKISVKKMRGEKREF